MHSLNCNPLQVQVSKTQRILLVKLHQFHNLYNVGKTSQQICCCGFAENYNFYCKEQVADLPNCTGSCDTRFRAYVSPCLTTSYPCSLDTKVYYASSSIDDLNDTFIFVLDSFHGMVRVNKYKAYSAYFLHLSLLLSFNCMFKNHLCLCHEWLAF